jgi:hypothetical protein
MKRCEGALKRIDGRWEQCDGVAEAGSIETFDRCNQNLRKKVNGFNWTTPNHDEPRR